MDKLRRYWLCTCVCFATLLGPIMAHAQTPNPQAQLASLNQHVAAALTAAHSGNLQRARSEYAAFDTGWFEIEDGIRDRSRQSYRDIETAMGDVKFALKQQPVDTAQLIAALEALDASNTAFIKGSVSSAGTPHGASEPTTFASALPKLDAALTALGGNDLAQASVEVEAFRAVWPDIEGVVAAKDGAIYQRAEALQAEASAALKAGQVQQATTTLQQLKAALAPFATEQRYGVFEATSILLREGLEALLIIAALLAFLQKAGHADKRRWIWIGGAAGIAASLLAAVAIQMLFSTFVNGANRELVEGITGLVAASLLFYVSYWLHSKTYLGGWHRYLKDKTNTALATGSLFSLAALAFLSVFREGAETTLFYIGIAPAIALRDLLLGLGIGTLLLVVLGVLIIGLGKRLPLAPFFRVTSLLIWYLGFKFIGSGIRALQIARAVPETTVSWLPSSDLLGLYPTWETTLPQLALLITAIVVVLWMRTSAKQMTRAGMTVNR